MTIKEVEKITGVSCRSIRFYEEKGLLNVKREKNNYRIYTDEDIQKLKLIKLLRYLDFSIEDISEILIDDNLVEALKNKIQEFEEKKMMINDKQDICNALSKDNRKNKLNGIIDHYHEKIVYMEKEEYQKGRYHLVKILCPSLSAILIQTLIFAAPIIALFLNILNKKYDVLVINTIFALFAMSILIIEWSYYFRYRKQYESISKQRNKTNSLAIPVLILSIIITLSIYVLFHHLITLMAPKDYLFYEVSLITTKLMIIVVVILILIIFALLTKKLKIKALEDLTDVYEYVWKKLKFLIILSLLMISYCFFTSITFVTKDKIIYHDPLHPLGIIYEYNDISQIETGFGTKNFALLDYDKKGQFYYRIIINDKQVTFMTPSVNGEIEKYYNDTYLELEEFDEKLMQYNIKKIRNDKYASACDLDPIYCDRFRRIINNK